MSPLFLPGPGPLEPSPHSSPPAPAADTFAGVSVARQVANFDSPNSRITNVFDPAANTFADWTPAPVMSRSVPPYSATSRDAYVVSWGQSVITDQYAPVSVSSRPLDYQGSRPLVTPVFAGSGFGSEYITPALSRQTSLYQGSYSAVANAADEPVPDDWTIAVVSRILQNYQPERSSVLIVADNTTIADTFAANVQSRRALGRVTPPSAAMIAATPNPDTFAQVVESRSTQGRFTPPSFVTLTLDNPAAATPDTFAASVISRRILERSILRSFTTLPPDAQQAFAFIIQSRRSAAGLPIHSVVTLAFDGPSGVIPDNPAVGGAGEFVNFRDPFRQNPFSDPFAKNPFSRVKVPRGER